MNKAMRNLSVFGVLATIIGLVTGQSISNNQLVVTSSASPNYDLQVSGVKFNAQDNLGRGQGLFSLTFNITDPWNNGQRCHFSLVFQGDTAFPLTFPCQNDQGLNVSTVALQIDEFPNDTDNWLQANWNMSVWHDVTFQQQTFRKQAQVNVPNDVGGSNWTCKNPGYGGPRVVSCGVRVDGQLPQDALPTFTISTNTTLSPAPRGSGGDAL